MGQVNPGARYRFEQYPQWVISPSVYGKLSAAAKDTYLALLSLDRKQPDGRTFAFGSYGVIGEVVGISEDKVSKGVRELVEKKLIVPLNVPRKGWAGEYAIVRRTLPRTVQDIPPATAQGGEIGGGSAGSLPEIGGGFTPPMHTEGSPRARTSRRGGRAMAQVRFTEPDGEQDVWAPAGADELPY